MRREFVNLEELKAQIKAVEGLVVGLRCSKPISIKPYPLTRPSPGKMRGREWIEQFEGWYPDVELTFPSEGLTLAELRMRYE